MAERTPPRWAGGLLRACLLAWPRRDRRAHGRALVDAALEALAEGDHGGGPRPTLAEAAAIVRGGLGRRRTDVTRAIREGTMGWTGDVRLALRTLRRSPGFTAVAALTLAVGIGANAAVFSLVDGVLLGAPPYERPEQLVLVWNTLPGTDRRVAVEGPDAAVLAERSERLSAVAFTIRGVDGAIDVGEGDGARHVRIASVTGNFFDVLGTAPALGRVLRASDAEQGGPDPSGSTAVVVSDALWRSAFAADPGVVGREVRLNTFPVTVVGVMPSDFLLALPPDAGVATDVDVWLALSVPLSDFHRTDGRLVDRDSDNTGVIVARLAGGATVEQARAEADRIAEDLRAEIPAYAAAGMGFDVRPLLRDASAHSRPVLLALLAAAAAVLLVACLNLATLLLSRGVGRAREFSVRQAVGGGRGRLVRQLIVENGVLVCVGLVAALLLAWGVMPLLASTVPSELSPHTGVGLDVRAVAFAAALATGAGLLCGLVPAVQAARQDARGALASGTLRSSATRSAGRGRLVAAQVSLSVVLVLGAGLLLRTVRALETVEPGFEPERALTFRIALRVQDRYGPASRAGLMKEIETRVASLPGVRAVGLVGVLPLGGDRWARPYGLPGQAEPEWHENRADLQTISSAYFEAIGAHLLEGRTFTPHEDLFEEDRVAVVDEKLAERIAPEGSAVGAVIGIPLDGAPIEARIVGVVEHVRHEHLEVDGREAIYVPYRQEASHDVTFVVRTSGDPAALAPAVRDVVRELDPRIPVFELRTLDEYVAMATAPRRFAFSLLVVFGGLVLACSALGLYGVVAFDVARSTRDIGVRMALGAARLDVVESVLARGVRLGAIGIVGGAALGALATRGLAGLVYGVGLADPVTWIAVVGLVALVTALASGAPAWRASRLDPTAALRAD